MEVIGYSFKNPCLLEEALTHPSFAHVSKEPKADYERLEFLGDSILAAILAEQLFLLFPEKDEGFLAEAKSVLAKGSTLAEIAKALALPKQIRLSPGEAAQGGKGKVNILASAWEAVIAAIFLDSDYASAKAWVIKSYERIPSHCLQRERIIALIESNNPKGRLQEALQDSSPTTLVEYRVVGATGPDHARHYQVAVSRKDTGSLLGIGRGSSKKIAEEEAARSALETLRTKNPKTLDFIE